MPSHKITLDALDSHPHIGAEEGGFIQLADNIVSLPILRQDPTSFTRLFTRARAEVGHALCLCSDPPHRLVIRVREGRYHLAGWPGEGENHHSTCAFHKIATELSRRSHYTAKAITEEHGRTRIRLNSALDTRATTPSAIAASDHVAAAAARRSVGLLGLLHWLWESSQLNRWHPATGRRSWSDCHALLTEQIADCEVNRQQLSEILYIVPPYRPPEARQTLTVFDAFRSRLGKRGAGSHRGLILGEIKDLNPTRYGQRITLRHLRTPVFATTPLIERAHRSYRSAFAARAPQGARRIALVVVDRTSRGNMIAVDLAVMLASNAYLPADSTHEVQMADALIAAGRSILKPLRYDGVNEVFPDFVVLDQTPHLYVEVYGMPGRESYENRKREKQAHYARASIPVLEWEVDQPMPDLTRHERQPDGPRAPA